MNGIELATAAAERKAAFAPHEQAEAEKRLLAILSPEQRASYHENRKFRVVAQDGSWWEVRCFKHHANLYTLNERGKRVEKLCAYVDADMPWADNLLVQTLSLITRIDDLRRGAIITPVKYRTTPRP